MPHGDAGAERRRTGATPTLHRQAVFRSRISSDGEMGSHLDIQDLFRKLMQHSLRR